MKISRTWITGKPQGGYLASVVMEIEAGPFRFQLRGMRLVALKGKTRLVMPNIKKGREGEWVDLISPLNQETRDLLEEAAVTAWARSGPPQGLRDVLETL